MFRILLLLLVSSCGSSKKIWSPAEGFAALEEKDLSAKGILCHNGPRSRSGAIDFRCELRKDNCQFSFKGDKNKARITLSSGYVVWHSRELDLGKRPQDYRWSFLDFGDKGRSLYFSDARIGENSEEEWRLFKVHQCRLVKIQETDSQSQDVALFKKGRRFFLRHSSIERPL